MAPSSFGTWGQATKPSRYSFCGQAEGEPAFAPARSLPDFRELVAELEKGQQKP
jgi:hypothetical protein